MSIKLWGDDESSPEETNHNKLNSFSFRHGTSTNIKHWGEIEAKSREHHAPDVTEDIEKSMSKSCLQEVDTEYSDDLHRSEHILLGTTDPLILYAICLHKYANELADLINKVEQRTDSKLNALENLILIPTMPEMPEIAQKHFKNCLNYIPKEFTPFSLGEEVEVPELSEAVVKQILIRCTATLTTHIGFETTHQSVLDLLTDVLETFLIQISQKLKIAQEDQDNNQLWGFPNIAERVLIEMGMGGVAGLHDYYQSRVVKYISVLQKRCKEMADRYVKLLAPKCASPVDSVIKNKRENVIEENVNESDIPEVHFSTIVGEVGLTLETGFQLLNSLEAETNLQNLVEGDEDANVNTSPSVLSIPETEVTPTLSPFAKKKRNK